MTVFHKDLGHFFVVEGRILAIFAKRGHFGHFLEGKEGERNWGRVRLPPPGCTPLTSSIQAHDGHSSVVVKSTSRCLAFTSRHPCLPPLLAYHWPLPTIQLSLLMTKI